MGLFEEDEEYKKERAKRRMRRADMMDDRCFRSCAQVKAAAKDLECVFLCAVGNAAVSARCLLFADFPGCRFLGR